MRRFLCPMCLIAMTAILSLLAVWPSSARSAHREPLRLGNPFFAFDNGVGRGELSPTQQAALLKELGYAGIGYSGAENLPERLAAMESAGLKVFSIYVNLLLTPDGYQVQFDLPKTVEQLAGHGTDIWLTIRGHAGPNAERHAVAGLREIADAAARGGLDVVLYPHAGFYVDTTDDGLRLAQKSGRDNVGTTFNLCHFLKVEPDKDFRDVLDRAGDRLMLVSINGADTGATTWDRLIQPLGQGDFDVYLLLEALKRRGYDGPIGLQCYNVPGPPRAKLGQSIAAWRAMVPGPGGDQ